MITVPNTPIVPAEQHGSADFVLRYEDISQDGQLKLATIPHAFSEAIWRNLLSKHPMQRSAFQQGILPILSRFVLSSKEVSVSPQRPLRVEACYQIARSVSPSGETERILANFWAKLHGKPSHPLSPVPESDTEVIVGEGFGEHIFTRPFAHKEERKVLTLEGLTGAPKTDLPIQHWSPPQAVLRVPEGATLIDEKLSPSETAITFGMLHTDGNQHVNSLVYPRLFEEAAVQKLSALGHSLSKAATQLDIRYRKPCFANEQLRVWLQLFTTQGAPAALAALLPEGSKDLTQARCYATLAF